MCLYQNNWIQACTGTVMDPSEVIGFKQNSKSYKNQNSIITTVFCYYRNDRPLYHFSSKSLLGKAGRYNNCIYLSGPGGHPSFRRVLAQLGPCSAQCPAAAAALCPPLQPWWWACLAAAPPALSHPQPRLRPFLFLLVWLLLLVWHSVTSCSVAQKLKEQCPGRKVLQDPIYCYSSLT